LADTEKKFYYRNSYSIIVYISSRIKIAYGIGYDNPEMLIFYADTVGDGSFQKFACI